MNELKNILQTFTPISLEDMDSVKLLNRIDSKYVMSYSQFIAMLPSFENEYQVLEINSLRSAHYRSLYFDTVDFSYYYDHHNGRVNRFKVRTRKYLDSDLCFFEIKHKNKGRTDKKRVKIIDFNNEIKDKSDALLQKVISNKPTLEPCLWNSFERITLVNNERKERLTFDIGLNFSWNNQVAGYKDVVIAEVKQEINDRNTPCRKLFKEKMIRQSKVSKYCIGMALLYPALKSNQFKEKFLLIDKIRKYA